MKRPGHIVVYQDKKKEWRWRVVASNGNTLSDSGEGFKRRIGCMNNLISLRVTMDRFEVRQLEK